MTDFTSTKSGKVATLYKIMLQSEEETNSDQNVTIKKRFDFERDGGNVGDM